MGKMIIPNYFVNSEDRELTPYVLNTRLQEELTFNRRGCTRVLLCRVQAKTGGFH